MFHGGLGQVNLPATLCADRISQTSMFWKTGTESALLDDAASKIACPGESTLERESRVK